MITAPKKPMARGYTMNQKTMELELQRLKAENSALLAEKQAKSDKARQAMLERAVTCKVSEKGALSVYGMGRFPVTLYKQQWQKLIANINVVTEGLSLGGLAVKE